MALPTGTIYLPRRYTAEQLAQLKDYNQGIERYQNEVDAYNKAYDAYVGDIDKYNEKLALYNKDLADRQAAYESEILAYNKAVQDYKATNNPLLTQYQKDYDQYVKDAAAYNKAVEDYNKGDRLTPFEMTKPVAPTDPGIPDFDMTAPVTPTAGEFDQVEPNAPTAPTEPGFSQEDVDRFLQEANRDARSRQQQMATAIEAVRDPEKFNLSGFALAQGGVVPSMSQGIASLQQPLPRFLAQNFPR